jgi:Uma2 family endonuclease
MDSISTTDALPAPDCFAPPPAPDHTQLPCTDGAIVENFHEHPQSILLTDCATPWLRKLCPDDRFTIGQNSGIYWLQTEPPLRGCKAPDWFCVLGVDPLLKGEPRRSYVLWQEGIAPKLAIEFVSTDGREEHDSTPETGKFWVYEQGIRIPYYAIYDRRRADVELHELSAGRYRRIAVNERGLLAVPPLRLELGIWRGTYRGMELAWLRFWDDAGNLLPTSDERAEQERVAKETALRQAAQDRERADRLAAKLRELGADPDA